MLKHKTEKKLFYKKQMMFVSFGYIFNPLEFKSVSKIANLPAKRDPVPLKQDPIKTSLFLSFERREKNLC